MKKLLSVVSLLVIFSLVLAACGATPEPETVIQTVEVEKTVVQTVEVEASGGSEIVHLVARCKASPPYENGRCDNLVKAVGAANAALAEKGDPRRIELEAIQDDADWGDYKTEFELASQAGEAPDIICSGHEHIGDWATAGYLTDITDMIGDYPEFSDVIDSLWESTKLNGRIWGVPQDAEARPMYYSKILLKKLGWSDDEIENLDDKVYAG
ncbi:MAG TPA: extracellular solute-binding protein, partial [Anaerolineae bacterium]|nr:extracellular solute-binding protein [Anaerolineae bacterium]